LWEGALETLHRLQKRIGFSLTAYRQNAGERDMEWIPRKISIKFTHIEKVGLYVNLLM
jgi:hypothetical protein